MFGVTMASEQSSADVGNHNDARVDALDELSRVTSAKVADTCAPFNSDAN